PSVRSYLSTLTDSTGNYFFRPELEAGRLLGYPVNTTTQLPTNLGTGPNFQTQIIFASVNDLIIADTMGIQVDSKRGFRTLLAGA
ncbi:MAG TPA: phage major capsid protein, partial [Acetobacteraceae bacterium]|nr:phage major capsid protein [Acetobacteraceae bacterium]